MARSDLSPAAQRVLALVVVAIVAVGYAALVPESADRGHYDHFLFRSTVEYMHDGEGYYDAMEHALADRGVTSARETAYRYPTAFLLWRVVPEDALWPTFLVLVVGVTAALMTRLTNRPLIVVLVAFYLLGAGRVPAPHESREAWLLVEFWTLPALAGAFLAHRRNRMWTAAGLALLAAVTREITVVVLIGGLLHALRRREPWAPWATGLAAFAGITATHLWLASSHVSDTGNDATLIGSGDPPRTILHMMAWLLPGPELLTVLVWVLAIARVVRRGEAILLGPLLAIPLAGLVVHRPYWGLVVIPFALLWAADELTDRVGRVSARLSRRGGTGAGGSSPPPRTPVPGAGTPRAGPAPPSGG